MVSLAFSVGLESEQAVCIESPLNKGFSTAGPWHQLYRAARGLKKLQYAKRFC